MWAEHLFLMINVGSVIHLKTYSLNALLSLSKRVCVRIVVLFFCLFFCLKFSGWCSHKTFQVFIWKQTLSLSSKMDVIWVLPVYAHRLGKSTCWQTTWLLWFPHTVVSGFLCSNLSFLTWSLPPTLFTPVTHLTFSSIPLTCINILSSPHYIFFELCAFAFLSPARALRGFWSCLLFWTLFLPAPTALSGSSVFVRNLFDPCKLVLPSSACLSCTAFGSFNLRPDRYFTSKPPTPDSDKSKCGISHCASMTQHISSSISKTPKPWYD